MKSFFTGFLIKSLMAVQVTAECTYFRISAKLLTCGVADEKTLKAIDPYQVTSDAPELEEPVNKNLLQVVCDCGYSLQGSDPRCDVDQSMEKSSIIAADDLEHSCRRGNLLCHDVCPSRLP